MERKLLTFIALVITLLFGASCGAFDVGAGFRSFGGVVVALAWIAVGLFGRRSHDGGRDGRRRRRLD